MNFDLTADAHGWLSLKCPACGWECTHINGVVVGARHEDGPLTGVQVSGYTGQINLNADVPKGQVVGDGRRQRIALFGACENGCSFSIVFTQHKGTTYIEAVAG